MAERNWFTLTPTLPRSTTKAEWKQAHRCARLMEKMLARRLKEMEGELQKAFRDLVVFGTCRVRLGVENPLGLVHHAQKPST